MSHGVETRRALDAVIAQAVEKMRDGAYTAVDLFDLLLVYAIQMATVSTLADVCARRRIGSGWDRTGPIRFRDFEDPLLAIARGGSSEDKRGLAVELVLRDLKSFDDDMYEALLRKMKIEPPAEEVQ